jgi:hypothetical protein
MALQEARPDEVTAELELEAETPPAAPPEETAEEEIPVGGLELTIESLPELSGLQAGDTITLQIQGVSEDGNTYTLAAAGEAEPTPGAPAGRALVEQELLGATPEV